MRSFKYFFIVLFLFGSLTSFSAFADSPVPASEIPQRAQSFLLRNFPDAEINSAVRGAWSYTVSLSNGVTASFSWTGFWTKLDGGGSSLPFSILNSSMAAALRENFPDTAPVLVEQVWKGYNLILDNGTQVLMSSIGQVLGYNNGTDQLN